MFPEKVTTLSSESLLHAVFLIFRFARSWFIMHLQKNCLKYFGHDWNNLPKILKDFVVRGHKNLLERF